MWILAVPTTLNLGGNCIYRWALVVWRKKALFAELISNGSLLESLLRFETNKPRNPFVVRLPRPRQLSESASRA